MTAITDTRKRSRDEDTCDFMPISKRINNLTLTSQSLGEQDAPIAHNGNGNGAAAAASNHHFMAISNQEIQLQHHAQHSLVNSYPNGMSHHYLNQHGQPAHISNYHQNHSVQSNHSNGFHSNGHSALGTNAHKHNHNQHHHHQQQQPPPPQQQHQQQQQLHHQNHAEPNNNQMEEVYRPELTADENPFYYDKNKLLFDLHVERERRHQSHH
ncbi:histidine-rich glycoprotein-like [Sitodiplosis mosellana]|uniref:histidine-rich glycoprotein-like n=1 Tax=Sitodiplosis mosellana TaxID=263140 RepID=UPI002444BA73|nr:histidine-rich glycoprotein-like [Sitodiplosis mosellana]